MSSYNTRFERRDLILAIVTAIIGGAATIMAVIGVVVLTSFRF